MTTLAQVCAAHAALAVAEYDGAPAETIAELTAARDAAEREYRG